jgi:hypothetical protein
VPGYPRRWSCRHCLQLSAHLRNVETSLLHPKACSSSCFSSLSRKETSAVEQPAGPQWKRCRHCPLLFQARSLVGETSRVAASPRGYQLVCVSTAWRGSSTKPVCSLHHCDRESIIPHSVNNGKSAVTTSSSFAINSAITPPLPLNNCWHLHQFLKKRAVMNHCRSQIFCICCIFPYPQRNLTDSSPPLGDGRRKCRRHVARSRTPDSHASSLKRTPGHRLR